MIEQVRKGSAYSVPQMQSSYVIKYHVGILVGPCEDSKKFVYKKFMSGSSMRNQLLIIPDDQIAKQLYNKEINTIFIVVPFESQWEMRELIRPYVIAFREYHRKFCLIITKMEPDVGSDHHFEILSYFRIQRHIFMKQDISSQELRDAVDSNILNDPFIVDTKSLEIHHILQKPQILQQNLNLFSFPMRFDKFIGLPSPEDSITHQPIQRNHDELSQSSIISKRSISSLSQKSLPMINRAPQIDDIEEEEIKDIPQERYPLLIFLLLLLAILLYVNY